MILVTLGTRAFQFDRLLNKLDQLCKNGVITEPLVVQSVKCNIHYDTFNCKQYFSGEEMHDLMVKSSLIITHGGTGTITDALKLGKKVIGVPRLSKFHEHIDDHQVELIGYFSEQKLIIGIKDVEELEQAILSSKTFEPIRFESGNDKIKDIIKNFLKSI